MLLFFYLITVYFFFMRANAVFRVCVCVCVCVCVRAPSVTKSCPTLFDLMDCSVPGSSDHGISQTKILWWVAIFSSKGSSQPRDWTCVSCIGRWILYPWATRLVAHKSPEITLNINKYILDEWVNVGKTPYFISILVNWNNFMCFLLAIVVFLLLITHECYLPFFFLFMGIYLFVFKNYLCGKLFTLCHFWNTSLASFLVLISAYFFL